LNGCGFVGGKRYLNVFIEQSGTVNSYGVNIPKYYSYGPRKLNIVLTQFRCSATFLNYDLLKVNIISNPLDVYTKI
jgi:hypothetical protein